VPSITIQSLGIVVEARPEDTIMAAARAQGYYWPTTCGGEGRCTTCAAIVRSGKENLSAMGDQERRTIEAELGPTALERGVRLACQARVLGDVELLKLGVRRDWHAETSGPEPRGVARRAGSS
jgi:2Fe-2S ferredoxin